MTPAPVIVWFRRDLRLVDHLPLFNALSTGQPIIPLFIFDPAILDSKRASPARLEFMLNALASLRDELRAVGGDLHLAHGNPADVLADMIQKTGATALFYAIDYTPYARKRDEAITKSLNIRIEAVHDRVLVPPHAVLKEDNTPYTVYTPFRNKWRTIEKINQVAISLSPERFFNISHLPKAEFPPIKPHGVKIPIATAQEASDRLANFMRRDVYAYAQKRDMLGNANEHPLTQTSFLSPYIRFGLISLREIYWSARIAHETATSKEAQDSVTKFVDEVVWHEFYTHILWHFPHVKTRNFNSKFDAMVWESNPEAFKRWCEGKTGYPVVDAAMRQLVGTGWIHNRARMIVASFLTKDLLIDWRLGEQFFMQHLIDGDTAANNGGWQWSAGTGTDAQPFFRVFNPMLQSVKFDPTGDYIR
ncbi:MAG: DNA photolyase family protein, partial [Anaerolineae bacterium]|nr:DNA photolyase family protein [Anaerolineae bacterium]